MISKVPILLTDVGEIRKYSDNEKNFYIVKPEDPSIYAENLNLYLIIIKMQRRNL